MNYVTTNIRIPEDEYLALKMEAARRRVSLAAIIRDKLVSKKAMRSRAEVEELIKELDAVAKKAGKKLKGFDSVKTLREMRYDGKW